MSLNNYYERESRYNLMLLDKEIDNEDKLAANQEVFEELSLDYVEILS
ncbi:hypothetical protein RV15_GL001364 [Enterococcus silesiacus]|uniref:Uncharacterized protein n=1 Tax=Enterococcus silesiacus TaxID=332949 RepID=A0AA91JQY7_9ENTE|nr:hypothetical protein RV15_GL001364 [Enterococcus silesiacus]